MEGGETRAAAVANIDTLQTGLPHMKLAHAKDFVRVHPDEENCWSPELCFVNVPIKGQKRDLLHIIDEDIAVEFLPSGKILHCRFALATKPYDVFFLAEIPTRNQENDWNAGALLAAEQAKHKWVQLTSRREEGVEAYKIDFAKDQDAFPAPKWPTQSLTELVDRTFSGRIIEHDQHPAILRLIGAKQNLS
jgi:hypothetical protein